MSKPVEDTIAAMPSENSDETRGWDDGLAFATALKKAVKHQLMFMRKGGSSEAYIDAWKSSAESIFFTLTDGKN